MDGSRKGYKKSITPPPPHCLFTKRPVIEEFKELFFPVHPKDAGSKYSKTQLRTSEHWKVGVKSFSTVYGMPILSNIGVIYRWKPLDLYFPTKIWQFVYLQCTFSRHACIPDRFKVNSSKVVLLTAELAHTTVRPSTQKSYFRS